MPRGQVEAFAVAAIAAFRRLYPETRGNPDYTAIVNERQHARLAALLDDARAHGATVRVAGDARTADRRLPLHVVTGVT